MIHYPEAREAGSFGTLDKESKGISQMSLPVGPGEIGDLETYLHENFPFFSLAQAYVWRWAGERGLDDLDGAGVPTRSLSAAEHRPADVVPYPLVLEDELANRLRELIALPRALEFPCAFALYFRSESMGEP
jgi:hypothetical protein